MTNRICGNCRHFVKIEGATTGHCTNPLVVSHQGRLVMYRSGEIGCRTGWKRDLWEPKLDNETDEPVAAQPGDRGRAVDWVDSVPTRPNPINELLTTPSSFNDDDLLDPRRTRDIREAIKRAREAKRRQQLLSASREPIDQPILSGEQQSGEDTVLDVRPAPFDRTPPPIVPPVSADEVRQRIDLMRQPRGYNDQPPSVHLDSVDEHFSVIPERAQERPAPAVESSPVELESIGDTGSVDSYLYGDDYVAYPEVDSAPGWAPAAPAETPLFDERLLSAEADTDETYDDVAWPEQAPWVGEEPAYEEWVEQRPKRRSWLGSIFHREPRPPRVDAEASIRAWEPEWDGDDYDDQPAEQPLAAGDRGYDGQVGFDGLPLETPQPPPRDTLPPLPYESEDSLTDDYLLAHDRFGDYEEDVQATGQIEHICATCRYFRPDSTCGNAFAFTFRRRVSEEYLSCASSIGAWWLPSDRYWEQVVDFTHHGQPTPLLDRFTVRADMQEPDDEIPTP